MSKTHNTNVLIEFTKWLLLWVAKIFGCLVILAIVIGFGVWGWNWWNYERHLSKIDVVVKVEDINLKELGVSIEDAFNFFNGDLSKVSTEGLKLIQKKGPKTGCSAEYPLMVAFYNGSSKTINNISIQLSAYLPGRSTNVLDWSNHSIDYDYITEPKKVYGACWKEFKVKDEFKNDPDISKLIYKGSINYVSFKD